MLRGAALGSGVGVAELPPTVEVALVVGGRKDLVVVRGGLGGGMGAA